MKASITAKRTFSLGNYQNIVFEFLLEEIPEEVWLDEIKKNNLYASMLLDIEYSYRRYLKLVDSLPLGMTPEEATGLLLEAKRELSNKLQNTGE